MGDLALAETLNLLGLRARAGLELDPGAQFLAVFLVRHADHLHRLDLGMPEQKLFDLARINVLAAADHHVLDAADNVAIAVLVQSGEIAGMHPAGAVDRLGGALSSSQ